MADNHIAGEYTFASDDIGAVHHARVKVMHGADGAATDVSSSSPLPVGGAAADDAAAAGNPLPIGGVYLATVDEVDDGDVGRLRMTPRRALIEAGDYRLVTLSPAALNAGAVAVGDVTVFGLHSGKFGSSNGSTYGGSATIVIPLRSAGYRGISIAVKNGATSHDQAIQWYFYNKVTGETVVLSQIARFTFPVSNNLQCTVSSAGAAGQGGIVGNETAGDNSYYSVPALDGCDTVHIFMTAPASPTTGSFVTIEIVRWT